MQDVYAEQKAKDQPEQACAKAEGTEGLPVKTALEGKEKPFDVHDSLFTTLANPCL